MRVSICNTGREFEVTPDQSLLEGATRAGMNLPHSCKGGNCGSCIAQIKSGEFTYPNGRPLGISDSEIAQRQALLCQARALTDIELDVRFIVAAGESTIKRLPCRIARVERLSHDVLSVYLRLPAAEPFDFHAGQYIDVMLSAGRRRSFSIASAPLGSQLLELHVRRVVGGELTEALFDAAAPGKLLNIEGPLGQFVYRHSVAPMLMIGGGTGLAPLNSMIRHVIAQALDRQLTLYWGVRSERDLYAHESLTELASRTSRLRYVPVLSEPSAGWTGARGWVHEAALRELADLEAYDCYASGPPAMVEAVRRNFVMQGCCATRLYFDSFDYAPDSRARQASAARTNS